MDIKRKGKCINFGNCGKADRKEIIETELVEDFVCPECGEDLIEETKKKSPVKLIAIIAAIVLIGGGAAAYFLTSSGEKDTPVSSLLISTTTLALEEGETETLAVTVSPENATNKAIQWTSSNPAVANVENGTVQALAPGNATITASALDGSKQLANCEVTVNKPTTPVPPGAGPTQPAGTGGQKVKDNTASTGIKVPGGIYKGETRQGKPHGNGTITYSSRTLIDDLKQRYAEPGDYVTGLFREGKIQNVKWYNKNGDFKETIIP